MRFLLTSLIVLSTQYGFGQFLTQTAGNRYLLSDTSSIEGITLNGSWSSLDAEEFDGNQLSWSVLTTHKLGESKWQIKLGLREDRFIARDENYRHYKLATQIYGYDSATIDTITRWYLPQGYGTIENNAVQYTTPIVIGYRGEKSMFDLSFSPVFIFGSVTPRSAGLNSSIFAMLGKWDLLGYFTYNALHHQPEQIESPSDPRLFSPEPPTFLMGDRVSIDEDTDYYGAYLQTQLAAQVGRTLTMKDFQVRPYIGYRYGNRYAWRYTYGLETIYKDHRISLERNLGNRSRTVEVLYQYIPTKKLRLDLRFGQQTDGTNPFYRVGLGVRYFVGL